MADATGGSRTRTAVPIDFSIGANPYFPTAQMYGELASHLDKHGPFQPRPADEVTAALARLLGLPAASLALATGSAALVSAIGSLAGRSVAAAVPTFGRFTDPGLLGAAVERFELDERSGFALDPAALATFARARGATTAIVSGLAGARELDALAGLDLVVLDETHVGVEESAAGEALSRRNTIVVRSMGETFGLHGIRFCYAVAAPALAARIRAALPRQSLTSVAGTVLFMLGEHRRAYRQSLLRIAADRAALTAGLAQLPGVRVYPSEDTFVLAKLPGGAHAEGLAARLAARHGVVVGDCTGVRGLGPRFVRIAVRPPVETERLLGALGGELRRSNRALSLVPSQADHGWARTG
ncbi:MAG: hypothetical protein QOI35_3280 [Cryptosporangiaceae bacterium]|nr:hypothetical protein [Cryptosporangiaceae bacterium]